jgi:serine/threonine-protein kinase
MIDDVTGRTFGGKYRVDSLLRKGGEGSLYRGTHVFMDKPVLLRIVKRDAKAAGRDLPALADRLRTSSQITHPNVLAVNDVGTENGTFFAACEGMDGRLMTDFLAHERDLSAERSVEIARQIASALAAAESIGAARGGLTPDDILVGRLADGDVVKVVEFPDAAAGEANPQAVLYRAPEHSSHAVVPDVRSDIYAIGIMLYQMLAGQVPFVGETPTDVVLKHAEEAPAKLLTFRTDLPTSADTVLQKALAKDPDDRYQTAAEFSEALTKLGADVAKPAASNFWRTAAVVVAGIALLAATLIYLTSVKTTNPATALETDPNGQPVQPINPATGSEEQSLAAMPLLEQSELANSNTAGVLPGGDGYNAWANGGAPPAGAPVPPGGSTVTVAPGQSPFMPPDCILQPSGIYLCPVPVSPTPAPKATPTPKSPPANANTGVSPAPSPTPKPAANAAAAPAKPKPSTTPKPEE